MLTTPRTTGERFERLVEIMARLRAPGGCPWDREQSFDTIKPYLLEETYEVLDAIDRRDWPNLAEELGDLMLQPVFFAQMAAEEGTFRIDDSLDAINEKLVRRHPHVFADGDAKTAGDVKRRWDEIKADEKKSKGEPARGLLESVPRNLPALVEAQQISSKAAATGFDWEKTEQVLDKLDEELRELAEARVNGSPAAIEGELGDLLFVVVNLARFLKVDPEQALRKSNAKFRRRFALRRRAQAGQIAGRLYVRKWKRCGRKRRPAMIETRALSARTEMRDAVRLQQEIWGFDEVELIPLRMFVVASKVGGQVFGAFDGARMIGFCLAVPGLKPGGRTYLHSHMLGVLPDYRDAGVGRTLKLAQRGRSFGARHRFDRMDLRSLEIKNAFFNIERLGAIVRRYVRQSIRHDHQPLAYRSSNRPLYCGMVDRDAARGSYRRRARLPAQSGGRAHRYSIQHREHSDARSGARERSSAGGQRRLPESV